MNSKIRHFILLIIGLTFSFFMSACSESEAASQSQLLEVEVQGMTCGHCAQGIKAVLKEHPEIKNIFISVEDALVTIEWDSSLPYSEESLKAWISKAGFDAGKIQTNSSSFEDWKENFLKKKNQES